MANPTWDASFSIQCTPQKAAAVRDALANQLAADPGVVLITWSAAKRSHTFTCYGVDTSTGKSFTETQEADDEDGARALYSPPKVIAFVQ